MTVWPELLRRAMVGTDRQADALPELPTELAALLPESADPAARLLTAAGMLALWRRAGRLPDAALTDDAPPAAVAGRACPAMATGLLARMLGGEHAAALGVWLEQAAGAGVAAPPTLLPALLDVGASRPELQAAIAECAGELGRWLAARNPAWTWLADTATDPAATDALPDRRDWDEGAPATRLAWLRRVRQLDPAAATETLTTDWKKSPAKFRAQALEVIAADATLADEALLEQALGDRAASVRRVATTALAGLAGSQLLARQDERAVELLTYEPGPPARLRATPPEELPADWARDGVEAKPPTGIGPRAWWLRQVFGSVPPATWQAVFERDPETLLAAEMAPWEPDLIAAWRQAAVTWQDRPWALALLTRLQRDTKRFRDAGDLGALLDDRRAQAMLDAICAQGTLPPPWLAARYTDLWDDELSALVARELLQRFTTITHVYAVTDEQTIWLCRAALQMPRAELSGLIARLHELPSAPEWLRTLADRLGYCLELRLLLDGVLSIPEICAAVDYPRAPLPSAGDALAELEFRLRVLSAWGSDDRPAGAGPRPAAAG